MDKNYYDILGVSKTASPDEIKAAYRKLAKQYHPDLHPGDKANAEKFKEINEANAVLSDETKRKQYDYEQAHPGMGSGPFGGFSGFSSSGMGGFEDIINSMFGGGFGGFGGMNTERRNRGADIQQTVTLSFLDAINGCTKEINYTRNEPCVTCKGTGAKDGTAFKVCSACGGSGRIKYTQNTLFGRTVQVGVCSDCGGSGRQITDKCPDCKGKGFIRRDTTVTLDIPAGADTNSYMRRRGFGQASTEGGESGDLIVVFRVEPHKLFTRKNMDLYVDLPIPFYTAALGGKVNVPTLDDAIEYEIPEGTQNGATFTIRGKGIKSKSGTGHLYLRVLVEVPTRLSKEQKQALKDASANHELKQYEKSKKYSDNLSALYGKDAYKK